MDSFFTILQHFYTFGNEIRKHSKMHKFTDKNIYHLQNQMILYNKDE